MSLFYGLSLQEAVLMCTRLFAEEGISTAALDARLLVCMAGQISLEHLIAHPRQRLDAEQAVFLGSLVERRRKGEPVARIFGYKEFWGRPFRVGSQTLIPRPDSELLVETALSCFRSMPPSGRPYIADIGTGSGCLLISLLAEIPEAQGVGVDISADALSVARVNAKLHGVSERLCLVQSCFLSCLAGPFDMIITNPPYIPRGDIPLLEREVALYDPVLALDGGVDGFEAIGHILDQVFPVLRPGGDFLMEIGFNQAETALSMINRSGLVLAAPSGIRYDMVGNPRLIHAVRSSVF